MSQCPHLYVVHKVTLVAYQDPGNGSRDPVAVALLYQNTNTTIDLRYDNTYGF